MTYEITHNEYKLIETVRAMKPKDELLLRKQAPDNPKEYVVFITRMKLFQRGLDTTL